MLRRPRFLLGKVLVVALRMSHAQSASAADADAGTKAAATTKRPVPNYDGRAKETTSPRDVALWAPRIVLSPLYLVSEFVVRRPLGALVSWAETSGVPKAFYDFFAFGPNHSAGFAPIGFIDFGFNPSVGAFIFWNDAGVKGHDISIHATTWGHEWLAGVFDERVRVNDQAALKFNFTAIHRPDLRFHGIGPDSRQRDVTRYGQNLLSIRTTFDARPTKGRANRVETFVGMRTTGFYEGHFDEDPGMVADFRARGALLPAGFNEGFNAVDFGARVALDTRRSGTSTTPPRNNGNRDGGDNVSVDETNEALDKARSRNRNDPDPNARSLTGLRLDTEATETSDLKRAPGSAWITYGGTLGGFLDLKDNGRVVDTSLTVKFVDPIGPGTVPFTELIDGGGDGPLRGFVSGRLRGRSVVSASLRYRWPIWVDIDGAISGSVGNVFGTHLEDFRPEKLRLSATIGIETVSLTGNAFQLLLGVGTDTFERGPNIDSVRLIIGSNRGF